MERMPSDITLEELKELRQLRGIPDVRERIQSILAFSEKHGCDVRTKPHLNGNQELAIATSCISIFERIAFALHNKFSTNPDLPEYPQQTTSSDLQAA